MASPLIPVIGALLDRVTAAPHGARVLSQYDQLLQFTVLDGESFYVEISSGRVRISPGVADPRPLAEAHEYKATQGVFEAYFSGRVRMSDAIHDGNLFPVAAHTTKRHIDHWVAYIVRTGLGQPGLRDVY